jgi:hypothetical protein
MARYFTRIDDCEFRVKEELEYLLDYRAKTNLENEMQVIYWKILDNLGKLDLLPVEETHSHSPENTPTAS